MKNTIFILTLFLFFASCREKTARFSHNGQITFLNTDTVYSFLATKGSIRARPLAGIPLYARYFPEQNPFFTLDSTPHFQLIKTSGADTIPFSLEEFFDPNRPDNRRQAFVTLFANGLKDQSTAIQQRSFPFIFKPVVAASLSDAPLNTMPQALTRTENRWRFLAQKKDTGKNIAIPINTAAPYVISTQNHSPTRFAIARLGGNGQYQLNTQSQTGRIADGDSLIILLNEPVLFNVSIKEETVATLEVLIAD